MRLVDLTHPLTTGMPVFPGDPTVAITPALDVAEDGVAVAHLSLGSHSGTHLDAPSHSIVGGRTVDRIPLDRLQGDAAVLQVRVAAGHAITAADLPDRLPDRLPAIVCVATGWDRHFGAAGSDVDLRTHPFLDLAFAHELWDRGARVLGVDALSPDSSDATDEAADDTATDAALPVHELWLGRDGVIVENLAGLTTLPPRVRMLIAPLPLAGVDGSPVRAMAWVPTESADSAP